MSKNIPLILLTLIAALAITGCAKDEITACTADEKLCPDGTALGRDPANNCEFPACPEAGFVGAPAGHVSEDPDECAVLNFRCQEGLQPFFDDTGCGCTAIEGKLQATDCTDPRPEACTMEYAPVCGWFDSTKIHCVTYPCAATYGNTCAACADETVISWTAGECPA